MRLLRSSCLVPILGSLVLAAPIQGPPGGPGGGSGPATGSASVTLDTPLQGNGIYWLNAVGSFSGSVAAGQPESYVFASALDIQGPDENGNNKVYADLGPSLHTLGPGQSASWTLDTTNTASTAVSGEYKATVVLAASPVSDPAALGIIGFDVDWSTVP